MALENSVRFVGSATTTVSRFERFLTLADCRAAVVAVAFVFERTVVRTRWLDWRRVEMQCAAMKPLPPVTKTREPGSMSECVCGLWVGFLGWEGPYIGAAKVKGQ